MKIVSAAALMATLSLPVLAQTSTGGGEHHHITDECKAAVEKICPNVKPGDDRIRECLKQHNTTFKTVCPQDIATSAGNKQ